MLHRIWESISWRLGLWNTAYRTRRLREQYPGLYHHLYPVCGGCGEERPDDDRVAAGMKCRFCTY